MAQVVTGRISGFLKLPAVLAIIAACLLLPACSPAPPSSSGESRYSGPEVDWIPYKDKASGLYGYSDRQGNIKLKPYYNYAEPFAWGRAVAKREATGMISSDGSWLIRPVYDSIENYPYAKAYYFREKKEEGFFAESWGHSFFSIENPFHFKVTTQKPYRLIYEISPDNIISEERSGMRGCVDLSDRFFVEKFWAKKRAEKAGEEWEEEGGCDCSREKPEKPCGCWWRGAECEYNAGVFIRRILGPDRVIVEANSEQTVFFYSEGERDEDRVGLAGVEKGILTPPVYGLGEGYRGIDGIIPIKKNGLYGFVDENGRELGKFEYSAIKVSGWRFFAAKGANYALLGKDRRPVTGYIFSRIHNGYGYLELATVELEGRNAVWDLRSGKEFPGGCDSDRLAVAVSYKESGGVLAFGARSSSRELYDVYLPNREFLGSYQDMRTYNSTSLVWLKNLEGKWGALDAEGKAAIDFIYDDLNLLPAGVANFIDVFLVKRNGLTFYVDATGREYLK